MRGVLGPQATELSSRHHLAGAGVTLGRGGWSGDTWQKTCFGRSCLAVVSFFVDIRKLDDTALVDDALMRDFYDLNRRAELHGREHAPFWTFREFLGGFRSSDSGERQELFAAYDGDRMVGNAVLCFFLPANTEKACFHVNVDVPDRRRGIGRALVE